VVALSASALAVTGGAAHAVTNFPNPKLTLSKLIPSRPWPTGTLTSVNANDVEGMVYVPTNNAIWVADDNRDRIFEIDATTGGLKSQITGAAFQTATQVGTNKLCSDPSLLDSSIPTDTGALECLSRTDDFESIVYDPGTTPGVNDVLYVTSGGCCPGGLPAGYKDNPTVWKLTRTGGTFTPSQWQALPEGEDPTAAGWRPSGGSGASGFYYGKDNFYRSYDFATNGLGTMHSAPSYLVGIDFTDASHVFITTSTPHPNQTGRTTASSDSIVKQYTFDGTSFTAVPGWSFPLKNTGMIDARDLALVGDTFFVSDGYDFRTGTETNGTTTPSDHPIYVYNLVDAPPVTWHYETLNGTGTGVSNDHFANGNALLPVGAQFHGFYGNTTRASLTHSWWDGTRWNAENLDGAGRNTNDAVGTNVTAIQYGGQVQLLYTDATRHSLRHAWWDGTRWNFETLDGAGGANGRIGTPVPAARSPSSSSAPRSTPSTRTTRPTSSAMPGGTVRSGRSRTSTAPPPCRPRPSSRPRSRARRSMSSPRRRPVRSGTAGTPADGTTRPWTVPGESRAAPVTTSATSPRWCRSARSSTSSTGTTPTRRSATPG